MANMLNGPISAQANTQQPAGAGQWTNTFKPFYNQTMGNAQNFLNMNLNANPFGQGGILSDPLKFSALFAKAGGYSVNPNNANVGGFLNNLRGNTQGLLSQATRNMANAGVAAGRGGMGVAGGAPAASGYAQDALRQIAGQYGDDYSRAMGWEMQNADRAQQLGLTSGRAYADLYGQIYGTNANTGVALSGQGLQAAQSADASERANKELQYQYWQQEAAKRAQEIQNQRAQFELQQQIARAQDDRQREQRGAVRGEALHGREDWWPKYLWQSMLTQEEQMPRDFPHWPGSLAERVQLTYGGPPGSSYGRPARAGQSEQNYDRMFGGE